MKTSRIIIVSLAMALFACGNADGTSQIVEFPTHDDGSFQDDSGQCDAGSPKDAMEPNDVETSKDTGTPKDDGSSPQVDSGNVPDSGHMTNPDSGQTEDSGKDSGPTVDAGHDSGCTSTCQEQYDECICDCHEQFITACDGLQQCLDKCECELKVCEGDKTLCCN